MDKKHYYTYKNKAIQQWITAVSATYNFGTPGFMYTQQDNFSNPIGYATQVAAEQLYDIIIDDTLNTNNAYDALIDLIKIRAVQNFSPEQAVGIIQLYKPIFQKLFFEKIQSKVLFKEYLNIESRIDALMLIAFNYYVANREKIYMQRVEEQKRQTTQLQRWAKKYSYTLEENSKKIL